MGKKNRRRDPKFPFWLLIGGAVLVVAAIVLVLSQGSRGGGTPRIMVDREFGASGDRIIIEECLEGIEACHVLFIASSEAPPNAADPGSDRRGAGSHRGRIG